MAVAATTVAPSTLAPDTTAELLPADLDFPVAVPASSTALELPAAATGHRVYVDGTLVGEPPSPMMVGCGRRVVQIGSIGRARVVALPCGERAALAYP
jgi:hypothetical protein